MDLKLAGKTAIVTGGSTGIGLAVAKELYREGVNVLIAARDGGRLESAVDAIKAEQTIYPKPRVVGISVDLSQADTPSRIIDSALKHFERIDILINNAGSAKAGAFFSMPEQTLLDAWNLKLLGYIRMVKEVAPIMMANKDGRIVNIIGGAGRTPSPSFLAGSTANAALINFTKGISKELANYHVRINAISPGQTATERAERQAEQHALANGISVAEQKAHSIASIPLGRMVEPAEIAAMAALLVSDRAASITGIEIVIDGGQQPGI